MKVKFIASVLVASFLLPLMSSCVTNTQVRIDSDIEKVLVKIDGQKVGTTPVEVKMSNAIWEDADITLEKDGYKDLRTSAKKEVKVVNLVCGLIIFWPSLLWVYGPKKNQYFELIKE